MINTTDTALQPSGCDINPAGHRLEVDVDGVLDLLLRCTQTGQALDLVWPLCTGWCRWRGRLSGVRRGVGGWWLDGPPAGLWLDDHRLASAWRLQRASRQGLQQSLLLCDAPGQPLLSLAKAPCQDTVCWHALLDEAVPVIATARAPAWATAAAVVSTATPTAGPRTHR